MKFGTVAIIGRSNVGKSTLLNRLLNEKIAIVSEKPQTTRTRILGVVHVPGAQIALLDTPGLHKPQHLLNRRMVRTAIETLEEADLLFVLMDAVSRTKDPFDAKALAEAIAGTRGVAGITGTIDLTTPDRTPIKDAVIVKAEGGLQFFQKIPAPR